MVSPTRTSGTPANSGKAESTTHNLHALVIATRALRLRAGTGSHVSSIFERMQIFSVCCTGEVVMCFLRCDVFE